MAETRLIAGACLCGKVRYEVALPTKWCAHCHCSMCRRAHGAGFVTWFGAHSAKFAVVAGNDQLQWYQSSPGARRGFCKHCGSTLFFEGDRWPGEMHITRASVAGEIDREPSVHVYYDARVPWVTLHDELTKLGGQTGTQRLE